MLIQEFLATAERQLVAVGIDSARLDAQLLLGDALAKDSAWLLAHPEAQIEPAILAALQPKLMQRLRRVPLAYIRGFQEFYGRNFLVNPAVLIPRPETETGVALLKQLSPAPSDRLLDVGTGSGVLAITAALEFPKLQVFGSDQSIAALDVAKQNAARLHAAVQFYQQDLLRAESRGPFRCIVANLPYVARSWERSPETDAEPATALFANDDGLAFIKQLIAAAPAHLATDGSLLLEADPRQFPVIESFARSHGFAVEHEQGFWLGFSSRH